MRAIRVLEREHRTIECVLDALDRYVATVSTSEGRTDLLGFVEFITQFADRIHHAKEEDILFQHMIRAGFPRDSGPLAVMHHEHDQGRALAQELAGLGHKDGGWSRADRERLEQAAGRYTNLLRQHVHKEDHILYPMAEARLGREALDQVDDACAQFEREQAQSGEKARLLSVGQGLVERYAAQPTTGRR